MAQPYSTHFTARTPHKNTPLDHYGASKSVTRTSSHQNPITPHTKTSESAPLFPKPGNPEEPTLNEFPTDDSLPNEKSPHIDQKCNMDSTLQAYIPESGFVTVCINEKDPETCLDFAIDDLELDPYANEQKMRIQAAQHYAKLKTHDPQKGVTTQVYPHGCTQTRVTTRDHVTICFRGLHNICVDYLKDSPELATFDANMQGLVRESLAEHYAKLETHDPQNGITRQVYPHGKTLTHMHSTNHVTLCLTENQSTNCYDYRSDDPKLEKQKHHERITATKYLAQSATHDPQNGITTQVYPHGTNITRLTIDGHTTECFKSDSSLVCNDYASDSPQLVETEHLMRMNATKYLAQSGSHDPQNGITTTESSDGSLLTHYTTENHVTICINDNETTTCLDLLRDPRILTEFDNHPNQVSAKQTTHTTITPYFPSIASSFLGGVLSEIKDMPSIRNCKHHDLIEKLYPLLPSMIYVAIAYGIGAPVSISTLLGTQLLSYGLKTDCISNILNDYFNTHQNTSSLKTFCVDILTNPMFPIVASTTMASEYGNDILTTIVHLVQSTAIPKFCFDIGKKLTHKVRHIHHDPLEQIVVQ